MFAKFVSTHYTYIPDSDVEVAGVVVVNSKNCRLTHSKLVFILSILLALGMMKKNNLPKIWGAGAVTPTYSEKSVSIYQSKKSHMLGYSLGVTWRAGYSHC